MIPEQVNLIDFEENYKIFSLPLSQSIKTYVTKGRIISAVQRFMYSKAVNSKSGSTLYRDQKAWKYMRKAFQNKLTGYDAAIGYLEGKPNFFVADCVEAKVKIGYIHSDYPKLQMDKKTDEKFFKMLDYIVGVSDKCADILKENFPDLSHKIRYIENITSPSTLKKLATENVPEFKNSDKKILLTVGRIAQPKGYDIAVDAAEILDKNGIDFKWFAIGKGPLEEEIKQKISDKELEEKFILLGERANPYPYLNGCDIYVQSSYYEGKSIAIDEAKCFAKPIVTTKFTTVLDQLTDGETALLAEIDAGSVAEKIIQLINDESLCKALGENLKKEKVGNEEEIQKFYELLGD